MLIAETFVPAVIFTDTGTVIVSPTHPTALPIVELMV
jgi:hypothetical protein